MANPGVSEILTTTLYNRTGKLADNVTKNNAILLKMRDKGSLQMADGGVSIYQEMSYAENSTYTRYSGYQMLNIQPSDVFTAADFPWRQAAVAVTISGLEGDIQNAGEERIINLLTSRVENAEDTMSNNISAYTIGADGALTLVGNGVAGMTGMGPTDEDVTDANEFLYVLNSRDHSISAFAINRVARFIENHVPDSMLDRSSIVRTAGIVFSHRRDRPGRGRKGWCSVAAGTRCA